MLEALREDNEFRSLNIENEATLAEDEEATFAEYATCNNSRCLHHNSSFGLDEFGNEVGEDDEPAAEEAEPEPKQSKKAKKQAPTSFISSDQSDDDLDGELAFGGSDDDDDDIDLEGLGLDEASDDEAPNDGAKRSIVTHAVSSELQAMQPRARTLTSTTLPRASAASATAK